MTFVSVADACRHLSVDAKTVRRWLAQAQLPLQAHPTDARKKGVSRHQLELLARLHQRSLLPLAEEPPTLAPGGLPPLPAALLALPDQLARVQAQLTALHQQVAELTSLLQPSQLPDSPAPTAPPKRANSQRSTSCPPASHKRPAATVKTPPRPTHVIPRVEYGKQGHYLVICPRKGRLPFEPDTEEWFAWVAQQDSFRFVGKAGYFTAHHEWRVPKGAWRAHRHIRNHVYIQRLAPNQELTGAVLEQAAAALQAHLSE